MASSHSAVGGRAATSGTARPGTSGAVPRGARWDRGSGDAGTELFHTDDRTEDPLDGAGAEGATKNVVGQDISDSAHDHGLVEREVTLGDLAGLHGNRVVEATSPVGLQLV